ncbi:hypothetical protein E2562_011262 [Oryza meyeriana var. granulata]|uniref:Uncharacterized protein n=1 Tax=Oryza meyeriana var. granulata TaxID=110450 RepID=A0A6G1BWX4_9ORYZ|nr:hypothetical protein E2562_011262 [Oryza meyeriana var. granulata]
MGYRPHRASIADRILLTKRKMEETKEAPVYRTTNSLWEEHDSRSKMALASNLPLHGYQIEIQGHGVVSNLYPIWTE